MFIKFVHRCIFGQESSTKFRQSSEPGLRILTVFASVEVSALRCPGAPVIDELIVKVHPVRSLMYLRRRHRRAAGTVSSICNAERLNVGTTDVAAVTKIFEVPTGLTIVFSGDSPGKGGG